MARTLVLLALFFSPAVLFCASIGNLMSLEGQVTVLRAGILIPSEKISEGFSIEPFDTVATGPSGKTDFRFLPATGLGGTIHFESDTEAYLDITVLKKEQTAGVELLSGAVGIRLTSVAGASEVAVRTAGGTFTGSGPQFRVVEAPTGDFLVISAGGRVGCQSGGQVVYASPGTVVETLFPETGWTVRRVNSAVTESYEKSWVEDRRRRLRDQASTYFQAVAVRYQIEDGHFQRAWERVRRDLNAPDQDPAAVVSLRRAAFPLERTLFLVRNLGLLLDQGTLSPAQELTRGYTAKDFFHQVALDAPMLADRLGQSRSLFKTLTEADGGDFPKVSDGPSVNWEAPFFR